MNFKEFLLQTRDKLLRKNSDNNGNITETVESEEEPIKYNSVVKTALDGILDEAVDEFFPETGIWYSNCFRRSTDLSKSNLPCHLRNDRWLAEMLKNDQNLVMITSSYIRDYVSNSKHFKEARHDYELKIVKWQIDWMRNGGEGWIVDEDLGGDFYIMSPVCDLAFRKGIYDTLTKIGMDSEVVEEGIEKNADIWRERYMKSAFANEFNPFILDFSFSLFGDERQINEDINKPTLGEVDPRLEEAWLKMRRYDYYQAHKDVVDKYGVVLPEMKMSDDEAQELRGFVSKKAQERYQEIEEYKAANERVRMKRLSKNN